MVVAFIFSVYYLFSFVMSGKKGAGKGKAPPPLTEQQKKHVSLFCDVTSCNDEQAVKFLTAANWDNDQAVGSFFESGQTPKGVRAAPAPPPPAPSSGGGGSSSSSSSASASAAALVFSPDKIPELFQKYEYKAEGKESSGAIGPDGMVELFEALGVEDPSR